MTLTRTILGLVLLSLTGCFEHQSKIPNGKYIHLDTGNTIAVEDNHLIFYLKKEHTPTIEPLRVSYTLFPDGRMELGTSPNPDIFSLIETRWFFIPPEIHRKERNTEEASARFAPSVE